MITYEDKDKEGTAGSAVTLWRDIDANEVKNEFNSLLERFDVPITEITTVVDTYQLLTTDQTIICNKATAFTVTLPAEVVGQTFTIKNIGAGDVTIEGLAADTIDGAANTVISQWECITVRCYSVNAWGIIAKI